MGRFLARITHLSGAARDHVRAGGWRGGLRWGAAVALRAGHAPLQRFGRGNFHCGVCSWRGGLLLPSIGSGDVTFGALCPQCGATPRLRAHRVIYERCVGVPSAQGRLLWFAPEMQLMPWLRSLPDLRIETSEPSAPQATHHFDIQAIDAPDAHFDFVLCHHVVEHVQEDRKALTELCRVLKPGGQLVLSVPIHLDRKTSIDFAQADPLLDGHWHDYGLDFAQRLPAGLVVEPIRFFDVLRPAEREQLGIRTDELLFLCRKPA